MIMNIRTHLSALECSMKYFFHKPRTSKRQRLNSTTADTQDLLHTFWRARGVTDHNHREKLIQVALQDLLGEPESEVDTVLPGAHAYWQLEAHEESRSQAGSHNPITHIHSNIS